MTTSHHDRPEDEAPDALETELSRLPRERPPPAGLRSRVVAELRGRGAFDPDRAPAPRWAAALAAAALIFAAGLGVGVGIERGAGGAPDGAGTALRVQRLGSALAAEVATLAPAGPGGSAGESPDDGQAREAAFAALRGVADQLARLPGQDDPTLRALRAARAIEPVARPAVLERWF